MTETVPNGRLLPDGRLSPTPTPTAPLTVRKASAPAERSRSENWNGFEENVRFS